MKSMRKDGRGHFPRGKRRNDPGPRRTEVLDRVRAAIDPPAYGVRSLGAIAQDMRVDSRTVRRWVADEDWPNADTIEWLDQWCDDPTCFVRASVRGLGRSGIAEAAELLELPVSTMRTLITSGGLDVRQIRALRRWLRER